MQEQTKSHRLKRPSPESRTLDRAAPQWPSYTGTSQLIGTSPSGRVTVYVDPSLGNPGLENARDLLSDSDRVAKRNDAIFGSTGGPVSVIVFALDGRTDGNGGADHMGCDFVTGASIEACASFGDLFDGGQSVRRSTGEALSRWCAADVSNNALANFETAPTWAQNGMQNYVDYTASTDRDLISVGCGMAFLSWLISLGDPLEKIAPAMVALGDGGTLAQLYERLTGDARTSAFPKFVAAARALPSITSDDPFGAAPRIALAAFAQPLRVAIASKLINAILADLAASKTTKDVLDGIHTILSEGSGLICTKKRPQFAVGNRID